MKIERRFSSMKKNKRILGIAALALVCVMAGTVIGTTLISAGAEPEPETVVLTSPFTAAIAKVRDSVVGVNNYQIVKSYGNNYGYGFGYGYGYGYGMPYDFGNGNGQQDSGREIQYGSGSGVVIEKEYVLFCPILKAS